MAKTLQGKVVAFKTGWVRKNCKKASFTEQKSILWVGPPVHWLCFVFKFAEERENTWGQRGNKVLSMCIHHREDSLSFLVSELPYWGIV